MIILRLEGGLGNIMFQYGLGRGLAYKNNTQLKFDINSYKTNPLGDYSFHLEAFNINIKDNLATSEEIKRFKKYQRKPGRKWFLYNRLITDPTKYVQEKYFHFDPDILQLQSYNMYIHGWWQTEKYFKDIREFLLKDYTTRKSLEGKNKDIAEKIHATQSISIHIRRLDYVINPKTRHYHGEMTKEYYDRALETVTSQIHDPVLFIFSDDIAWVKDHMPFPYESHHIDWNFKEPHEDIRLMSLCKHNIIANSTLGWWGAWLNQNENKIVVGPKQWFANSPKSNTKDILPESWIKI